MKAEAIMVTPKDNVVTVVHGAKAGEEVHYFKGAELCSVITTEDPPLPQNCSSPHCKGRTYHQVRRDHRRRTGRHPRRELGLSPEY